MKFENWFLYGWKSVDFQSFKLSFNNQKIDNIMLCTKFVVVTNCWRIFQTVTYYSDNTEFESRGIYIPCWTLIAAWPAHLQGGSPMVLKSIKGTLQKEKTRTRWHIYIKLTQSNDNDSIKHQFKNIFVWSFEDLEFIA